MDSLNNIILEIKNLTDIDIKENGKQYYHPINILRNGKPTKKALAFNRKLLTQKKTFKYLDLTKRWNPFTNRIYTPKRDKRYKNKIVFTKKFRDEPVMGQVLNKNILNKTNATSSYIPALIEQLNILQDELLANVNKQQFETKELIIDLTKISLKQALNYIKSKLLTSTVTGKVIIGIARPINGKEWITLSDYNINNRLNQYEDLKGDEFKNRVGSDNEFIFDLLDEPKFLFKFFLRTVTKKEGAFFKYYHLLKDVDLDEFGVFNKKPSNYNGNCFYNALKVSNLDINKLNDIKIFVKSGMVPCCKLNKICDKLKIQIKLSTLLNGVIKVTTYGSEYDEIFKIGLISDHFFAIKDTNITSYAIKNYDDICEIENYNKIIKCKNGKYEKSNVRFINSFQLIKLLLENKDKFLINIPIDDILCSQYYKNMIDNDELKYISEECIAKNEPTKTDNTEAYKIFFDFETNTQMKDENGNYLPHKPYLMCGMTQDNKKCDFIGDKCGQDFIYWIKNMFKNNKELSDNMKFDEGCVQKVLLIAHNCRYDFTFILDYLSCLKPLLKGNRLMGGSARIYISDRKFIKVLFQDSYNLITSPLRDFNEMFQLEHKKEILPYDLYNTENIRTRFIPLNECLKYIDENDKYEYTKNASEWGCLIGGKVDILEYSKKYCYMDCKVLMNGYNTFRKWMKEVTKLDIINYCSIASISLDYLILNKCFNECYKIAGRPQNFIQKCVVGGRCMTKQNKKWIVEGKINDFDAVNLYGSAMKRFSGILKGKPHVIKKENLNLEFLNKQDGYFIKVMCLNNGVIRDFPLLSNTENDGIRNFSNETEGKIYYLDKTSLEDAMKYQRLEFKIICGYYYKDGHNDTIKNVIQHLFEARLEAKDNNNPVEAIYKLLMNSCYGKCLLKPIESEIKIISNDKINDYVQKNYNYIKEYTELKNNCLVKETKTINEHFNNVYAGVEILSMSKRIMNEVMCTAEDAKLNIYYQDTDSMHINDADIKILSDEFKKKYDRELIGSDMGQFHSDFKLKGAASDIYATKSIFLGKKCYLDLLESKNDKGETITGTHIRMKGISKKAIEHYSDEKNKSICEIYEHLYEHNKLWDNDKFDLLAGGKAIKFVYNKNLSVSSCNEFKRSVNFKYEKGI